MTHEPDRQICNYEGSAYRSEFWGQGREYEDAVERVAIKQMLPPTGRRLLDIGGGYGRLVPLYSGYDEVVIFDYALTQLRQGQQLWGAAGPQGKPRYTYVAGDFYRLPFAEHVFDAVVMVRALHHAADAPAVLRGASSMLSPVGAFVLEFANKRNLKAILRYLSSRQSWSPFDEEPVEFVPLNFDFHPAWIRRHLEQEGLRIRERRAVSTFRLALLKRLLPTHLLVTLDTVCQPMGELLPLSPSVFVRCDADAGRSEGPEGALFRCTSCNSIGIEETERSLSCTNCGVSFPMQDGIYNFKAPQAQAASRPNAGPQNDKSGMPGDLR
jgi:ubiquinone/menaquinone biosynthesis C-methylase UbiE